MDQTDAVNLAVVGLVVAADQVTKALMPGIDLTTRYLRFHVVHNTGGMFGLLQGYNAAFTVVTAVVLGALWMYRAELPARSAAVILGGGLGNLIDRLVRGHVVDFIDVAWWPVFNVADAAVSLGVLYAVISLLREDDQNSSRSFTSSK